MKDDINQLAGGIENRNSSCYHSSLKEPEAEFDAPDIGTRFFFGALLASAIGIAVWVAIIALAIAAAA